MYFAFEKHVYIMCVCVVPIYRIRVYVAHLRIVGKHDFQTRTIIYVRTREYGYTHVNITVDR